MVEKYLMPPKYKEIFVVDDGPVQLYRWVKVRSRKKRKVNWKKVIRSVKRKVLTIVYIWAILLLIYMTMEIFVL